MEATEAFGPDGAVVDLDPSRRDTALSLLTEHGLTDRLTLRFKGEWQSGDDAFVDYEGRGPLEIGVAWQAWRDDWSAVSLYAGYADGGEGRNAGYAAPGEGDSDWEVRAAAGRSFAPTRWTPGAFVDLQAARRWRAGLPDEARLDATGGLHLGTRWTVLGQVFAGATDDGGPRWASVEGTVVRRIGPWSLQAGWRRAAAGRETPLAQGPVVAVWRRF